MLRKRHKFPLVDNVENEVEDGGEGCAGVLSAGGDSRQGGDSNRVVIVGRNNEVGIGRDGELENLMDLSIPRADRSLQSERGK